MSSPDERSRRIRASITKAHLAQAELRQSVTEKQLQAARIELKA
jgi:hypothetical protein